MKAAPFAAVFAGLSFNAHAVGHLADVTLIDRDTGTVLPTYFARGEYWVAGTPGARYAIQVCNPLGERLLAVMTVDGVNILSGETASWGQNGYVFGPGVHYQVAGWRKSDSEVAAFEFTAVPNAYATLTGRPQNVGVIGVALFRERTAPPPVARQYERINPPTLDSPRSLSPPVMPAPAAAAAPSGGALLGGAIAPAAGSGSRALQSAPAQALGTAHGEREYSYTYHVDFEREQDTPNEIIRIRYDSVPNLIAMGIMRRPSSRGPEPNPFPDAPLAHYVPDPPHP